MATNKGIPVINNFDLYAQKSLDSRLTIENEQELGELINKGAIYDGMIFYRKDAQKFFQAQYLESGLKISEFGGSSGGSSSENIIVIKGTEDSSSDFTSYTITLTEEQFNKIYDNEYGVILNLADNYSFLPTIKRNLLNGKKTITLGGIQVLTWNSITGLSTARYNNVDFTTDSLTKTLSTLEYSFLNYKIDDNNNLKLRYLAKESSSATEKNITGYALPTIENLTQDKEYTIKATKTKLEWVDMPSTNTSLPLVRLTITPEQFQEFLVSEGNAQITFTQEQKEQLLANLPCMFWLAWPDTDGVKSECLLSGFIAFSPFPIRGNETVNNYTVLFFIEGDTYVGTNSPTDTGTHDYHSTIDNLDLPIYLASYLQDDIGANQEGIIFSYRTGEDLLIKFPKINNTQIADNANNYYAPTELNATSTPKILQCVNSTMSWVDVKTYYNHFIYLTLETTTKGTATIRINFTTTSNELINTLDKLKSALGETFTLGGNGSIVNGSTYGTTYMLNQNGITGVLNGAQSVFNFADGTLTITDSVKRA